MVSRSVQCAVAIPLVLVICGIIQSRREILKETRHRDNVMQAKDQGYYVKETGYGENISEANARLGAEINSDLGAEPAVDEAIDYDGNILKAAGHQGEVMDSEVAGDLGGGGSDEEATDHPSKWSKVRKGLKKAKRVNSDEEATNHPSKWSKAGRVLKKVKTVSKLRKKAAQASNQGGDYFVFLEVWKLNPLREAEDKNNTSWKAKFKRVGKRLTNKVVDMAVGLVAFHSEISMCNVEKFTDEEKQYYEGLDGNLKTMPFEYEGEFWEGKKGKKSSTKKLKFNDVKDNYKPLPKFKGFHPWSRLTGQCHTCVYKQSAKRDNRPGEGISCESNTRLDRTKPLIEQIAVGEKGKNLIPVGDPAKYFYGKVSNIDPSQIKGYFGKCYRQKKRYSPDDYDLIKYNANDFSKNVLGCFLKRSHVLPGKLKVSTMGGIKCSCEKGLNNVKTFENMEEACTNPGGSDLGCDFSDVYKRETDKFMRLHEVRMFHKGGKIRLTEGSCSTRFSGAQGKCCQCLAHHCWKSGVEAQECGKGVCGESNSLLSDQRYWSSQNNWPLHR